MLALAVGDLTLPHLQDRPTWEENLMSTEWLVVAGLAVFAVAPWALITMRPPEAPTLDD